MPTQAPMEIQSGQSAFCYRQHSAFVEYDTLHNPVTHFGDMQRARFTVFLGYAQLVQYSGLITIDAKLLK